MSDELVDKREHNRVGCRDGVESSTRGEGQEDTGGEDEEEESSCQKIHPHGSLSRR